MRATNKISNRLWLLWAWRSLLAYCRPAAGRGVAVVVSRVRNLAQRSASAAKEVRALINDSVTKVADGSDLVRQAGAAGWRDNAGDRRERIARERHHW